MKVPFNDLGRAVASEGEQLTGCFRRVAETGWFILGQEVRSFEEEFAAYVGVPHAISVANGTDALELALRALGVKADDEVLTVANAGMYASTAIRRIGAVPAYVDVDAESMNLDPVALQAARTSRTAAVILTHLYGQMADVDAVAGWCGKQGLPLVEDCAQSHGARRSGRQAGSWGDVGCFSFYPTKNLGALGDGGAVTCSDHQLAGRLRALRQYGWEGKYDVRVQGGANSRLDEIQAAILRERLRSLDARNLRRVEIATAYGHGIRHPLIKAPKPNEAYVAHLYVVRSPQRDALRQHLTQHGVATDVHYPIPDHLQRAYAPEVPPSLPNTERLARDVLSLPCFPELTEAEVRHVIEACNAWSAR